MLFLRSGEKNCFSWTNHNYFTHQCLHLDKYTHKYEWRLWTSELVLLHTWQSLNLSMKLLLLQYRPSKVNSLCCPVELPPSNHGGGGGGLILFVSPYILRLNSMVWCWIWNLLHEWDRIFLILKWVRSYCPRSQSITV